MTTKQARELKPGDIVHWADPDMVNGSLGRSYLIGNIEVRTDMLRISSPMGDYLECPAHEIDGVVRPPAHGATVTVRIPGCDWSITGRRVSEAVEARTRDEQGWQEEAVLLEMLGKATGTAPACITEFFGEGWYEPGMDGGSLWFDPAPGTETGWSLLLERSEYAVILEVADAS